MPPADVVKCVCLDVGELHPDYGKSWCGRPGLYRLERVPIQRALETPEQGGEIHQERHNGPAEIIRHVSTHFEWTFVDAAHALTNARNDGRLLICRACAAALREALDKGTG